MKRIDLHPGIRVEKIKIGRMPALVLSPKKKKDKAPGVLWIHGGGYIIGFKEMVYIERAVDLVRKYGAVVITPGYRLAWMKPYPAAVEDCYKALVYLKSHTSELGIRDDQIMVGGESAGGGLAAAVCIMARDKKEVNVSYQMPLYPMISNIDTESSRDNHGKVWNTRLNHIGWKVYLRDKAKKKVSPYASPIWVEDMTGLPPAYTFIGDGEPFYTETLDYIKRMQEAGVPAEVDVYPTDWHSFDLIFPRKEMSRTAIERFNRHFEYALENYFAPQVK